jgi:hypothetical protein
LALKVESAAWTIRANATRSQQCFEAWNSLMALCCNSTFLVADTWKRMNWHRTRQATRRRGTAPGKCVTVMLQLCCRSVAGVYNLLQECYRSVSVPWWRDSKSTGRKRVYNSSAAAARGGT